MKTNKIQLEDGVRIKPYIKIKSLYQNQNVSTWRGKFIINGKRKTYSANPSEDKDDAFITINQKIYDELSGKVVKKRQTKAPTLSEIAKAYLAASKSQVSASQETRKNYLASLRNITAVITSGREPVFEKQKNGRYEVVDAGYWDRLHLDKLDKKVARKFLDSHMAGYVENTDEWHIRARGANNRLRQARLVFSEDAMNEVYIELFKMPDLNDAKTGFLKAKYLPAREKVYQAPSRSVVEQILDKIPELAKTDPDVYACFLLQYGCGLSWGEVMHARYSWLGEADSNIVGDSDSGYVIKVQPDGDWIPKTQQRQRAASVPENIFQALADLQYVSRNYSPNHQGPVIKVSDEELTKLIWSEPARDVGKRFGVSSTTVVKTCDKRGIPRPDSFFWRRVFLGKAEHPNGIVPEGVTVEPRIASEGPKPSTDYILQRHRCNGYTGANRRLARWFRANIDGWDRVQVGHELRKLNISMVICSSGSMYQGSKHAGHSSIKVTETTYGDILNKKKVEIPLPGSS